MVPRTAAGEEPARQLDMRLHRIMGWQCRLSPHQPDAPQADAKALHANAAESGAGGFSRMRPSRDELLTRAAGAVA